MNQSSLHHILGLTHTHSNPWVVIVFTSPALYWNPNQRVNMQTPCRKLLAQPGHKLGTFLLWGNSTTHWITKPFITNRNEKHILKRFRMDVRRSELMHFCLFTHTIYDLGQTWVEIKCFLFLCKCRQCEQPLSHHQWLLLLMVPEIASSQWKWMMFGCCESLSLWTTLNSVGFG